MKIRSSAKSLQNQIICMHITYVRAGKSPEATFNRWRLEMQFYKDGFRGGNPDVKQAAPNRRNRGVNEPLPEKVDVLIAGTGPAGLCLAAQLSLFTQI